MDKKDLYIMLMEILFVFNILCCVGYGTYIRKIAEFKRANEYCPTLGTLSMRFYMWLPKVKGLTVKQDKETLREYNAFSHMELDNNFEPYDEDQLKDIVMHGRRMEYLSVVMIWCCYAIFAYLVPVPEGIVLNVRLLTIHVAVVMSIICILVYWFVSFYVPKKKNWYSSREVYANPMRFRAAALSTDDKISLC